MIRLSRRALLASGLAAVAFPARLLAAAPDDVAIAASAYRLLHPGLLRYQSAADYEARVEELARAWPGASLEARYLALARFTGAVRCGHSYGNFYNQSKAVRARLLDGPGRLPLRFRWLGDDMVVTQDPAGLIAPGSIVRSIDGRPTPAILAALLPITRADGGNDAKRRQLLSVIGNDEYETFDCLYPLLFPVRDRFTLSIEAPDGKRREHSVAPITQAERLAARSRPESDDAVGNGWSYQRRGSVAVLRMDNWGLYDSTWDWAAWLDNALADLDRGTASLVIDIRANEGGIDGPGEAIMARLIDAPMPGDAADQRVRYRSAPADLVPYLDTWDPSFRDWGDKARPLDERFFLLVREEAPASLQPRAPRFTGRVALLVGPENSSATFQFARLMQRHKLATLAGEPTGGNRRGINGGAFFFLRLPDSGLEIDLPLIGYFPREPEPDAGINPEIPAPLTAIAVAAGADAALERAIALVA